MDNKENSVRLDAAKARLRRKAVLQEKNKKKQCNSSTRIDTTPLADITQTITNSHSQSTVSRDNQWTQPNSDFNSNQRKRIRFEFHDVAVNLERRYNDCITQTSYAHPHETVHLHNANSTSTFNSSFNFNSRTTTHSIPNYEDEVAVNSENDSTSDEEEIYSIPQASQFFNNHQAYSDIGDPITQCQHCQALMWYQERMRKHRHTHSARFYLCCSNGKVQLPVLKNPPSLLQQLLFDQNSRDSKNYQQHIRVYNTMFAFTSPGIKLDRSLNNGKGPPNIRVQGQSCHRIGSLLPLPKHPPKFAQLYIYDTENEIKNRMDAIRGEGKIDPNIVANLSSMLDEFNVHAKSFRQARERLKNTPVNEFKLVLISNRQKDGRIYNIPTVSEVAAIIPGDVNTASHRDIILQTQSGDLQRIDELHTSYLGFQYPLLFPYGEDGYRHDVLHRGSENTSTSTRIRLTIREWLCFRLQSRSNEAQTLLRSRRLFQQFVVDGYMMLESERLSFIRRNQSKLRVDKYCNLNKSNQNQQSEASNNGKRVILPSTFVGGRRYMDQLYFDGMAICSHVGFPDLFITFTCNPTWPEIERQLSPLNLKASDRPDIIARVFKIKFEEFLADLTKKHVLGKTLAYMYTIEFQKRGLPHAHLLIFMHPSHKYPTPADIDKIISAEIPSEAKHKELYNLVKSHMIHGPCGIVNKSSPCMKSGKCSRFFPKKYQQQTIVDQQGYPVYRRRNNGSYITKNGVTVDNRYVVPYNPHLLLKFQAHINIEWCNQSTSIKYLFKYINKGYDRITASIVPEGQEGTSQEQVHDEIKHYLDCRYISPSEACWRIFSFPIHSRKPAVERMFFHLPGEQAIYFKDNEQLEDLLLKPTVCESMFTSWMAANQKYSDATNLTYAQFVSKFVYVRTQRSWKPRKKGYTIGRLIWIHPNCGELYYLRMMLTVCKGPTSYEDIRTVGNILYPTFKDACFAMGFLQDDKEYLEALREAKDWGSAHYLRKLFVTMLTTCNITTPEQVWEQTWQWLSDDILYQHRKTCHRPDLELSDEEVKNLCLLELEKLLEISRKSLKDFPSMPYPNGFVRTIVGNRLIYNELDYNVAELNMMFERNFRCLTDEQRSIFQKIMTAVDRNQGGMFFLYGYGGTGKTFIWETLAAALRRHKQIVLTVASSGIASLLLPGGRTAHSKFKIPVPTLDDSICNIHKGSELAELLKLTSLIIWDEAPMANKYCFEALDKSLRDIIGTNGAETVFGGKVIVFGGDFRQILPVIPRGDRSDIVHSAINSSYLWDHCEVLTLSKNMRLESDMNNINHNEVQKFAEWILQIGDGQLGEPNDGYASIEIPDELLIQNFQEPISAIVESTYPNLIGNFTNEDFLHSRAILASTMEIVDEINNYILAITPGEEKEYLSSDSVDKSDTTDQHSFQALTPEFLHSLHTSGLPNHSIKLKVGTPIMLLRNIDQSDGLCNGTRLVVTKLANHVIEAKVMTSEQNGGFIYIPRMSLSPSQSPWPFKLIRRQFPIIVCYAMTINKSQGQSLSHVGLYLPKPVFSHGQLYVAISRVRRKDGLKILIHDAEKKPSNTTINVVYKEIFHNI